jgi:hypothetical protein
MSIAYIRLSPVLLKIRKNTHRCWKLLLVPMWTVSLFNQVTDSLSLIQISRTSKSVSLALAIWRPDQPSLMFSWSMEEEAICRCIDR